MLKRCIVIVVTLSLLAPLTIQAEGASIVINSFRISNGGEVNDEFVELLNKGSEEIDISNWRLRRKTATGGPSYLRTKIPEGTKVIPGGKYIIAHPVCSCDYNLKYATTSGTTPSGLAPDNTIVILDAADTVIDKVGYGKALDVEASGIAESPGDGEIYTRKDAGQDTDNNLADFYLSYTPPVEKEAPEEEPKENEEETEVPATAGADIRVTEFMPNPEGADTEGEWIEIYNAGQDANISGYAIADKIGSPKKYKFPKGTLIKARQYLAFYSSETPISLNNDDEGVEIISPEGEVISSTPNSGKGPEGASYASDGRVWAWTSRPTPGRANIIEKPVVDSEGEGQVLALVDENDLPAKPVGNVSGTERSNELLLGYSLIALAIIGAISYTLYVNKEKLREIYFKIRKRDYLSGPKIWRRLKRGRGLSTDG